MNETIKNIITRKSCKSYQDKHVDKNLIKEIVAAGLNAPSGMNKQTPLFVVVTDDLMVKKLSDMNAAWSLGVDSRWIHRAKEMFNSEEGKELLKLWGIKDEVEGIGFCILGYAKEEKEKTVIQESRVFYV